MNEHHPRHPGDPQEQPGSGVDAEPDRPAIPEKEPQLRPRVWIGSLADYNNGLLIGDWIDAAVADEVLIASAKAILERSEEPAAEEWAIFDHDEFGSWQPGEHEDLTIVARVARGIAEHGPAFAAWADQHDADPEMLDRFIDAYFGHYDSPMAWADTVMDDLGWREQLDQAIPEGLARYVNIDTAGWAQGAWLSGDILIVRKPGGGVWIFDARA